MDYNIDIQELPTRAGRMITGGYQAVITHPDGRIAARAPKPIAPEPAKTEPALRDRQADRVARLIGLPPARNDGRCHYCGQPLSRRGYCEECV